MPASFAIRAAALTLGLISVAGASAREEVTVLVDGERETGALTCSGSGGPGPSGAAQLLVSVRPDRVLTGNQNALAVRSGPETSVDDGAGARG